MEMVDILEGNGDLANHNLILKMDVEGAEWEFILNTPLKVLNNFDQMVFEFHGMTRLDYSEMILKALKKINLTHQLVWLHGNNYGLAERASGILLPTSLEVLYLNRKNYKFRDRKTCFPIALDMPCNPRLEDFELGIW